MPESLDLTQLTQEKKMSGFDIGRSFAESWTLYKRHFLLIMGASLVATVLSALTGGILAGPMFAGLMLLFFKLMDDLGDARFEDIFKGFDWFLPALLIVAIWGGSFWLIKLLLLPIPLIGQLAFLLLSIASSVFIAFALCDVVAHNSPFYEASQTALNMLKKDFWPLMAYGIIVILISASGILLLGVGSVVTLPFGYLMMAVAYRNCQKPPKAITVNPKAAHAV
jgi:hypothetical protein